jgi:hypothetical protein
MITEYGSKNKAEIFLSGNGWHQTEIAALRSQWSNAIICFEFRYSDFGFTLVFLAIWYSSRPY